MKIPEAALRVLERRGIDPAQPGHAVDPEQDVPAWLAERWAEALEHLVPYRFRDAETTHPEVLGWVEAFVRQSRKAQALVLLGPTGSGKSHQSYAAFRAATIGATLSRRRTPWCRVTTHPRLVADARPQADGSHRDVVERCEQAHLLLIDDLGAVPATDWSVGEVLFRIIDHRWANCLATIYTSNLSPGELRNVLGDRVVSRLADGLTVTLTGDDRRLARKS